MKQPVAVLTPVHAVSGSVRVAAGLISLTAESRHAGFLNTGDSVALRGFIAHGMPDGTSTVIGLAPAGGTLVRVDLYRVTARGSDTPQPAVEPAPPEPAPIDWLAITRAVAGC